jgi:eukaryotic-like serine/threonine-protein kinase
MPVPSRAGREGHTALRWPVEDGAPTFQPRPCTTRPMADIREQLQQTLGSAYTLDRELGGGGMSRVFVADETRLGRKVVVKLLSPELAAGVSAERFEREIRTAASLQQANIVPVLSSGESNGLPFYTMPFVDGQSLRARLAKDGALSITEIVRILGDVARALSYAHAHGVVHRDIKPDNVLLSGGTAVVTDFGIAKAISASRTQSDSGTLTLLGTSLGTPAYMSPEQAAGDPDIDHRSDIYAFGCMAYELLAGRPPFAGRTPQRVLAAQMGEAPQPITELRADTPRPLADLVTQCLAKDAASRPQSAADLARVLDTVTSGSGLDAMPPILLGGRSMLRRALLVYAAAFIAVAVLAKAAVVGIGLPDWVFPGAIVVVLLGLPVILFTGYVHRTTYRALTATPALTPGGRARPQSTLATIAVKASPHVTWRRTALGGAYAVGAFIVIVGLFMLLRALGIGPAGSLLASGKLGAREPLLVADFKAGGPDSGLSGVLAEAMRTTLGESKVVSVVQASTIASALQLMRRPADSHLDLALARELAQREGIKAIVDGSVTPITGGYVVSTRLIAAASGDELASFQETVGGAKELISAVDGLARKLRGRIGESLKSVRADPPLENVTTTSLEALKKYAEGAHANDVEGDYLKSVRLLEEAVALDTSFGAAYRKLGQAIANSGVHPERAAVMLEKAYQHRDRMTERERLLTTANYLTVGGRRDRAKGIAAYEALVQRYPEAGSLSNLAGAYVTRREFVRAESTYQRALSAGGFASGAALSHFGIIFAQIGAGRLAAARSSLALAQSKFPEDARVNLRTADILYAEGKQDSAVAYYSRNLSARVDQDRANAHNYLASASMLRGQFADYWRHIGQARVINESRGQPRPPLTDSLNAAQNEVWFYDRPNDGLRKLDAALARQPLASLPLAQRQHLRVASLYAMFGRADRARAMLTQYDADVKDTVQRRLDQPAMHSALGWVALADAKPLDAVVEFRKADRLPDGPVNTCPICADVDVGRAFDRANMPDSAIAAFEHYMATPFSARINQDGLNLAWISRRLGELYEAKGDRAKAGAYYQKFVDLWKNADPDLQPKVAEVRQRLARLKDIERR